MFSALMYQTFAPFLFPAAFVVIKQIVSWSRREMHNISIKKPDAWHIVLGRGHVWHVAACAC
jgi:hypothetical protein